MDYQAGKRLLVYGAGLAGRQVAEYLQKAGYPVHGFLDQNASICFVSDVPVFTSESWLAVNDPNNACIIIGLFNNYVDVGLVVEHLEQLGYCNIVSLIEFVRDYPVDQPFRYWLVEPTIYEQNSDRIAGMRKHLADDVSRELLDSIVEFRITGNYRCLPKPSAQQYFPEDLPQWPRPLRFIDCGAYTGDTVQAMSEAGIEFDAVATFEPNLKNYQLLVNNLKNSCGSHFPCGVSNSNRQSSFDPKLGAGGHLVKTGGDPVFCVRLDDVLPGFAPNLIKMDIEGEEPAALRGAESMLRAYRPNLAISIYHQAEHLWSIFEQLHALDLDYRFFIRCHAYSTFDTILYAFSAE